MEEKDDLRLNERMMKKILRHDCGSELNEFSDELAADDLEIGESEYHSTAEYTMIDPDDAAIDYQGS